MSHDVKLGPKTKGAIMPDKTDMGKVKTIAAGKVDGGKK